MFRMIAPFQFCWTPKNDLVQLGRANFMKSSWCRPTGLLTVKQRMKSVENIQKITKAMKMVAASKMRAAQAATEQSRGIVGPLIKMLGDLPGGLELNEVLHC